jgi:hypothetical protein
MIFRPSAIYIIQQPAELSAELGELSCMGNLTSDCKVCDNGGDDPHGRPSGTKKTPGELLALHDKDADGFLSQREFSVRLLSMISGARVTMRDGCCSALQDLFWRQFRETFDPTQWELYCFKIGADPNRGLDIDQLRRTLALWQASQDDKLVAGGPGTKHVASNIRSSVLGAGLMRRRSMRCVHSARR